MPRETRPGLEAPMWDTVAAARDKEAIRFPRQGGGQFLLYSRTINDADAGSRPRTGSSARSTSTSS